MANITILGRIGREPELKTTQGGTTILSFPVADSKKIKGEEKTTWYDCAIFGQRATSLQQYIRKGEQIYVVGEHELQTWTKEDGSQGAKCAVMVSDIKLIGGQQQQGYQQQAPQSQGNVTAAMQQRQPAPQQPAPQGFGQPTGQPAPPPNKFDDFDSDIPFR